ncbi:MAG: hypothetical protein NWS71_05290, partial [Opitutales bacterium]|nr:hypothetical protein [Opitutales bacterium]
AKGEIVIYYDADGNTKFFECLQDHAGDYDPNTSAVYWSQLKWGGRNMPPLDLRLQAGSYYSRRGMGLTYKE